MTSSRPYLIRALYEWITDNQLTPYILVDAEVAGAEVPKQYVEDGKIILNISPQAVNDLAISNRVVEFNASFAGSPAHVFAPIRAVLAIYARENGRGMVFNQEEEDEFEEPIAPPRQQPNKAKKPKLSIVKSVESNSKE
jgi:stringent starvation protein B